MADIFDEIRTDLEQEKWLTLWKKYQKHLSALITVIIIITAGTVFWQRRTQSIIHSQSNSYIQAMYLMDSGQKDKALQKFERIPLEGESIYATLSRLWVAASLSNEGDEDGAEAIYKKVLSETKGFLGIGGNKPLYNFTLIKWAYLILDTGNPEEILEKVKPLTTPDSPWRFSAWEISGLLKERLNDPDGALGYYEKIFNDPKVPAAAKIKAQALINVVKSTGSK